MIDTPDTMKSINLFSGFIFLIFSINPCIAQDLSAVPSWAKDVVWYQIFVERFRNGDPSNDPRLSDMQGSYPGEFPQSWSITPWGHDWYAHESWLDSVKGDNFYSKIQTRRYGGDLQGVLDKLDYLKDLGITAIFFNPLNDAPSLHKYDAANYAHIDRNFGPDPDGDIALMKAEKHDDPSTWEWTSADKMFLKIIDECHKRNIRIIMDYSWNHTGPNFWALEDVRKNGNNSPYKDWYNIRKFDDPATPQNEFSYEGWGGNNPWMPVFKKDIIPVNNRQMPFEGNFHSQSLKEHIFSVTRRWLDPDGNGDPSDGVDGFRLDVAGEIPMGFWREYRKVVKALNPEAYLVGEIWWLEFPDKLLEPSVYLKGDQYDAIMNYRWYRIARGFFAQAPPVLKPSSFVKQIMRIDSGITENNQQVMMNVAASHDSPRLSTSFYNKNKYKFRAKPSDDPDYKINKPDEITRKEQLLLLVHQFTYKGAPHIWNGDELGMWGADDPDCRKPLIWDDIKFEDEKANYYPEKSRPVDVVRADTVLIAFYRKLIKMRKDNPVLSSGELKFVLADDGNMLLGYSRKNTENEIYVIFNRSTSPQTTRMQDIHSSNSTMLLSTGTVTINDSGITLEPLSAVVVKINR